MIRAIAFLIVLALGACSSGSGPAVPQQPQNVRPGVAPDIILLSVSGRCGVICNPPEENQPYLGDPGDAAEALQFAFLGSGQTVDRADYIAALYDYDDFGDFTPERYGFLTLVSDLQWIFDNWIDGFANPTRIVIVAHSHGCVWAHMACSVVPHIPIDYLISLDASCLLWDGDYGAQVADYIAMNGNPWSWDVSAPCDEWPIPGQASFFDTDDVAFDNVLVNLEVQATGLIQDTEINYRLDGTRVNIVTHASLIDDHGGVHDPFGDSMPWVVGQLAAFGY